MLNIFRVTFAKAIRNQQSLFDERTYMLSAASSLNSNPNMGHDFRTRSQHRTTSIYFS